jgi:hypothetical protein
MRKAIFVLSVLYLAAIVAALGYLSDGFTYTRALHESFIVLPLALGAVAMLVVILLAIGRKDFLWDMLSLFIVLGSLAYVVNEHHSTYGSWLPDFFEGRVETSGDASLLAHGQTVRYRLDLHYPGTVVHREYLVVTRDGTEQRVRLPLFKDTRSGYVSPKQPADWIVLRATADREVFEAETGRLLLTPRSFRVNLASGTVKAQEPKPVAEVHRSPAK